MTGIPGSGQWPPADGGTNVHGQGTVASPFKLPSPLDKWREAEGHRVLLRAADDRDIQHVHVVQVTPRGFVEVIHIPPRGPSRYLDSATCELLEVLS